MDFNFLQNLKALQDWLIWQRVSANPHQDLYGEGYIRDSQGLRFPMYDWNNIEDKMRFPETPFPGYSNMIIRNGNFINRDFMDSPRYQTLPQTEDKIPEANRDRRWEYPQHPFGKPSLRLYSDSPEAIYQQFK